MIPRSLASVIALLVALMVGVTGCAGDPAPSFDPRGPCTADGAAPGAYPELEALVPSTYHETAPERLDSGRNCTPDNLGSLAGAGIEEVRFAGGTWSFGEAAVVLARFTAPGLTADLLADYYAKSAAQANRTEILGQSSPTIVGRQGRRLDTKTGERQQTVIVWPAFETDHVNVVVTHDMPEDRIQEAIAAFAED